jgi:hypothetical protein
VITALRASPAVSVRVSHVVLVLSLSRKYSLEQLKLLMSVREKSYVLFDVGTEF